MNDEFGESAWTAPDTLPAEKTLDARAIGYIFELPERIIVEFERGKRPPTLDEYTAAAQEWVSNATADVIASLNPQLLLGGDDDKLHFDYGSSVIEAPDILGGDDGEVVFIRHDLAPTVIAAKEYALAHDGRNLSGMICDEVEMMPVPGHFTGLDVEWATVEYGTPGATRYWRFQV